MCDPFFFGSIGAALTGTGTAAAAGATAAAGAGAAAAGASAGLGGLFQGLGLLVTVGGSLMQASANARSARQMADATARQRADEARLTAVEDQRTRQKFQSQMRQQAAELIGRGVSLDSPTAVLLGQTAAQEMNFASQEVRSRGSAKAAELTDSERIYRAKATNSWLEGGFNAAGAFLKEAPEVWPELLK